MKAPEFQPEKEWRLVSTAVQGEGAEDPDGTKNAVSMNFRVMRNRLVPYIKAQYERGKSPICSITSGPTIEGSIAAESVVWALKKYGYPWKDIVVGPSKIQLRE